MNTSGSGLGGRPSNPSRRPRCRDERPSPRPSPSRCAPSGGVPPSSWRRSWLLPRAAAALGPGRWCPATSSAAWPYSPAPLPRGLPSDYPAHACNQSSVPACVQPRVLVCFWERSKVGQRHAGAGAAVARARRPEGMTCGRVALPGHDSGTIRVRPRRRSLADDGRQGRHLVRSVTAPSCSSMVPQSGQRPR